jgi:uncharacterized protein (DUF1697 family)
MTAYVALIRGINVGRAKRVGMADLRALVESFGYKDVRPRLNSGNVVFAAPASASKSAAARIEKGLATRIGVPARVVVLSGDELDAIVRDNPLEQCTENPSRFMVIVFMGEDGQAKVKPLVKQSWAPEALAVGRRAAYLWCPDGIIDSRAFKALGAALGDALTTRNWTTMKKLQALVH